MNLLKFEWRKLWRQKSLYICFGIGLLIITLAMLTSKTFDTLTDAVNTMFVVLSTGFTSFLGIFMAVFVCHDFSQQTIKNVYARGYQRTTVYFAKYFISLVATLLMVLLYLAYGFVLSLMLGGEVGSLLGWQWGALALQVWSIIGFHGLFFGVGMLLTKVGGTVALNLVGISFCFQILNLIFVLLEIDFNILDFSLETLFTDILNTLIDNRITTELVTRAVILPLSYVVIFVGAGWYVNQRRDV